MTDMELGALAMWVICSLVYVPTAWFIGHMERRLGFAEGLRVNVEALVRLHYAMRKAGEAR